MAPSKQPPTRPLTLRVPLGGGTLLELCLRFVVEDPDWVRAAIADGRVRLDGRVCTEPDRIAAALSRIQVFPSPAGVSPDPVEVVYQDRHLAVVIKPPGLPVLATAQGRSQTLEQVLGDQLRGRLWFVHRLDRPVSGLMVVARSREAAAGLDQMFREDRVRKVYLARTLPGPGLPAPGEVLEVEAPLHWDSLARRARVLPEGQPSHTRIRRVGQDWVLARLLTGRTHQIRAHLAWLGAGIRGDDLYGPESGTRSLASGVRSPRIELHAMFLCLTHPITGKELEFLSLPPAGDGWFSDLPPGLPELAREL